LELLAIEILACILGIPEILELDETEPRRLASDPKGCNGTGTAKEVLEISLGNALVKVSNEHLVGVRTVVAFARRRA